MENINKEITLNHTVSTNDFINSYKSIGQFFQKFDSFKSDYFFFRESTNPDELRAKIEEKLKTSRE